MPNSTTYYGLTKPLPTEAYDVTQFNANADKLDAALHNEKAFDITVRTQAEFDALIASPDWLGAESVCFVGDGGTMKFTVAENTGITIPLTVRRLQGAKNAILDFTFSNKYGNNKGCMQYSKMPVTEGYSCSDITVISTAKIEFSGGSLSFMYMKNMARCNTQVYALGGNANTYACGYYSCENLYDCGYELYYTGSAQSVNATTYGFHWCKNIINPVVKITAFSATGGYLNYTSGFYNCNNIVNATLSFDGGYGMRYCNNIVNAIVTGNGKYYALRGFAECNRIDNCMVNVISTADNSTVKGIEVCSQISNCDVVAQATGTGASGIAINRCNYINGCYGSEPSTTAFLGGANTFVDTATVGG